MPTKTKETSESKSYNLNHRIERSEKSGEWKADVFEASLKDLKPDDLGNLFDWVKLPQIMQELVMHWYDGKEINPAVVQSVNADWMLNPTDEQNAFLISDPVFVPAVWKKLANDLDLEHRKVTPDDKGNVSVLEPTGKMLWDENGKEYQQMRWSKDGQRLFAASEKSSIYNFVFRGVDTMKLEPKYAANIKKAVGEGYRTVQQRKSSNKLTSVMVKAQKQGKTKTVAGHEVTNEQIEAAVAEFIKNNPDALSEDQQ